MAKEKQRNNRSSNETEPQKKILQLNTKMEDESPKRKANLMVVLIPIAICIVCVIAVITFGGKKQYNDFEVLNEVKNQDVTQMSYLPYNNSFIKYSKEGICCLDKNGMSVWVESYKMKQPAVAISDEYIAVADLNGNTVYIFNAAGKVEMIETPYKICNIDVASQGVFAVVLENETENFIQLYDKFGTELVGMRTTISDSGYPLDIALSENGTKMMTSYITVEGIEVTNTIAAYNFGEVGQNATDRLVGGFNNLGDTIVPKIEFLNNDTVCAFGDNQFILYSMKEKPSEKCVISDFQGEIQSIFYNSKCVGIVEKGAEDSESLYQIRCFDLNGKQRFCKELNFSYNQIYATETELFVIGSSEVRIYDMQGRLKFSYAFSKEVKNIVPTGVPLKYIIVYDDGTEVVKLLYTKENQEGNYE